MAETAISQTPYVRARQEWDERFGDRWLIRSDFVTQLQQMKDIQDRARTLFRCGVAISSPCSVSRVSASRTTDWLTPNRSVSSTIFSFWPGCRPPLSSSPRRISYTRSVRVAGVAVTPSA